jgi:hypothetical protein
MLSLDPLVLPVLLTGEALLIRLLELPLATLLLELLMLGVDLAINLRMAPRKQMSLP